MLQNLHSHNWANHWAIMHRSRGPFRDALLAFPFVRFGPEVGRKGDLEKEQVIVSQGGQCGPCENQG